MSPKAISVDYYINDTYHYLHSYPITFNAAASFHVYSIHYASTGFSVYVDGNFLGQLVQNATIRVPVQPMGIWFFIEGQTTAPASTVGTMYVTSTNFTIGTNPPLCTAFLFINLSLIIKTSACPASNMSHTRV